MAAMKLVILYGPPAVGKLTVATELAHLTGFKLFHNHLTADAVMSLFPHGSAPYKRLIKDIRIRMLEAAVLENLPGVILTLAFNPANPLVLSYLAAVENLGGEIYLVRLYCDEATLRKRVVEDSRKAHGKITDVAKLEQKLLEMNDAFALIPDWESLELSTNKLSPKESALRVQAFYGF